ncbi:DUF1566 domain-containing protein [candidate division KSB1 bacterium]|nr:DUF1566 domain-containing protein [candidate division KSB1 bacterium]
MFRTYYEQTKIVLTGKKKTRIAVIQLRKQALTLTTKNIVDMILEYDFFDADKNPKGKGLLHLYDMHLIEKHKVVIDETTKLMWQRSGMTYLIKDGKANQCIKSLNRKCFAGYSDWRLPTLEEAMSLLECQKKVNGLYIDPLFDKEQNWIWTADLSENGNGPWYVSFLRGIFGNIHLFNYGLDYVRAVRSL